MMIVVPFKGEHLSRIALQPWQAAQMEWLDDKTISILENADSYTILDGDEVLLCAGVILIGYDRHGIWSYISKHIGRRMLFATREAKRFLNMTTFRRIEMDVDCDFQQAHRWARMLGFELESERRKKFTPDGRDCALYARVAQ